MIIENKTAVSFDLDMTLLDHRQNMRIPDSALATIEKIRGRYKIILATGRDMHTEVGESILKLLQPDAVIHMNGARVEESGSYLASYPLPVNSLHRLIREAINQEWCVGTYIEGKYYCTNPERLRQREEAFFGASTREAEPSERILEQEYLYGISAMEDSKVIVKMQKAYRELCFMKYGSEYGCDIVKQGVSKEEGVKILLKKWGITFDNVIAFGDSTNDIKLLKASGIGIAMGNAQDEVKRIADYVTEDIGESGIQKAFQYLGII